MPISMKAQEVRKRASAQSTESASVSLAAFMVNPQQEGGIHLQVGIAAECMLMVQGLLLLLTCDPAEHP